MGIMDELTIRLRRSMQAAIEACIAAHIHDIEETIDRIDDAIEIFRRANEQWIKYCHAVRDPSLLRSFRSFVESVSPKFYRRWWKWEETNL